MVIEQLKRKSCKQLVNSVWSLAKPCVATLSTHVTIEWEWVGWLNPAYLLTFVVTNLWPNWRTNAVFGGIVTRKVTKFLYDWIAMIEKRIKLLEERHKTSENRLSYANLFWRGLNMSDIRQRGYLAWLSLFVGCFAMGVEAQVFGQLPNRYRRNRL